MAEILTAGEQVAVEAVVAGVLQRTQRKRRSYRRGWGALVAVTLSLPVLKGALDGTISAVSAVSRMGLALVVCWAAADLFGTLVDRYQSTAAISTVTGAIHAARSTAHTARAESAAEPSASPVETEE